MTGASSEAAACDLPSGDASLAIPPSHYGHDLKRWPLHNSLSLGALEGAVPSARAHVRQLLWEWGLDELGQDVGLVVSELVGNAVKASAEFRPAVAPIQVWLGSDAHRVLVAVADASSHLPVLLNPNPDSERGRGLALVEAFSNQWGWRPIRAAGLVKVVWAEWAIPHPRQTDTFVQR